MGRASRHRALLPLDRYAWIGRRRVHGVGPLLLIYDYAIGEHAESATIRVRNGDHFKRAKRAGPAARVGCALNGVQSKYWDPASESPISDDAAGRRPPN